MARLPNRQGAEGAAGAAGLAGKRLQCTGHRGEILRRRKEPAELSGAAAIKKSKEMKEILTNLKAERSVLVVVDELDDNVVLATRNLNNVLLLSVDEINTMDIVSAKVLIATESAVKSIEEALV